MKKNSPHPNAPKPNDQRATVKNPTSPEFKKATDNRADQIRKSKTK